MKNNGENRGCLREEKRERKGGKSEGEKEGGREKEGARGGLKRIAAESPKAKMKSQ